MVGVNSHVAMMMMMASAVNNNTSEKLDGRFPKIETEVRPIVAGRQGLELKWFQRFFFIKKNK